MERAAILSARGVEGIETSYHAAKPAKKDFEFTPLPRDDISIEELIQHRKRQFANKRNYEEASKLIPIRIKIPGPIGILHFGDPHVDDDGTDIDIPAAEFIDQLHCVRVVGNTKISPDLFTFDVACVYAQQDIGFIPEMLDQPHFYVGIIARQDAGSVIVKQELPPELKVKLIVKTIHAFKYLSPLLLDILIVVEAFLIIHKDMMKPPGRKHPVNTVPFCDGP